MKYDDVGEDTEKLVFSYIVEGTVIKKKWLVHGKIIWQFLTKLHFAYNPVIPLWGIYTRETKTYVHLNLYTGIFIEALFIIGKTIK